MSAKSRSLWTLLLAFLIVLVGCMPMPWQRQLHFSGLSDGDSVDINHPFAMPYSGIQIVLNAKKIRRVLLELGRDLFVFFSGVISTKGDTAVAVFTCGTPITKLAYDLDGARFTSIAPMEPMLAADIRARYKLDLKLSDRQVFEWACSENGTKAFQEVHPESIP